MGVGHEHECETRRRRCQGAPIWQLLLVLLLSTVAGEGRRGPSSSAEAEGCPCSADRGCIKTELGCVVWSTRGYPEWNIMAGGLELTPERTALISVLGAGKDIVMLSPSTPHAVLAAHRSRPASLLVLHHRSSACRDSVATLQMAGGEPEPGKRTHAVIVHGLASPSSRGLPGGAATLELQAPPATLADWYTMRRLHVGKEAI